MPIPQLTPLPDPPLSTDSEEVFNGKADATLLAEKGFVDEMNTKVTPAINQAVSDAVAAKDAAAASATAAAHSVDDAEDQVQLAGGQAVLAAQARAAAETAANNARASATAAENAQGSIGNLALLHALTIAMR